MARAALAIAMLTNGCRTPAATAARRRVVVVVVVVVVAVVVVGGGRVGCGG